MKRRLLKKCISILIIFTIMLNISPNFGLLKITKAVNNEAKMIVKPGVEEFETVGEEKIFKLNVYMNNVDLYAFVVYLTYPKDKIIPCDKSGNTIETTTSAISVANTIECSGGCEIITNSDASSIINTETGAFGAAFEYNAEETIITEETLMCTILFKVKKDDSNNLAISNISELSGDDFSLTNSVDVYESMITDYEADDIMATENPNWFIIDGFNFTSQPEEKKVESLTISGIETEYLVGDTLDLSSMVVTANYSDGTSNPTTDYETNSDTLDLTTAGTKTLIVTYTGTDIADGATAPTASVDIEVREKQLTQIEITNPTNDIYTVGDTLDLTGLTVTAIYDNGETPTVTDYTTSIENGAILNNTGVQTITVTYSGKSATFDVLVFPTRLSGTEGENLSAIDIPEGFAWVNNSNEITVGENEYSLKYINTSPEMEKTCNVKVLGIPSNLTATYGDTLANVKYNGLNNLPTGFAWENSANLVGDVGEQIHNITYTGYTGLSATVTVSKKILTKEDVTTDITLPATKIYDGNNINITATVPVGAGEITVKYYNSKGEEATETKDADTYTVKISVLEGTNYTALAETEIGTYTVGKAMLTANDFEETIPENKEYDGQPSTATASLKEGIIGVGTVTVKYYEYGEIIGTTIAPSDYGTYIVKVNVSEGTNYFAADGTVGLPEIEIGSFSITKKQLKAEDIEVTAPTPNEYDGTAKTPAVTSKVVGAGTIQAKYYDEEGNEVTNPTEVGTYTVKITTSGATNYENVTTEMEVGTFEIVAREITVAIDDKTSEYGEELVELAGSVTVGSLVTGDTIDTIVDLSTTATETSNVGEYTITGTAKNNNYNVTIVDGKYEITAREITVTIDDKTSVYGKDLVDLTSSVTAGSLVTGDTIDKIVNLSTTATSISNAGEYEITGTATNTNYDITIIDGTYEITKATLTAEDFEKTIPQSKEYDGDEVTATASIKPGIVGAGTTIKVKYYVDGLELLSVPKDYGTYIVKVNINEGTNYFAANGTVGLPEIEIGSFSITKKQLKAEDIEVTAPTPNEYDGTAKTPAVTSKVVGAGTIQAKYYDEEGNEVTNPTEVGTYTVKITTSGATNYENVTTEMEVGTFEIVAREITVAIDDKTSEYGEELVELAGSVTVGSLVTGDTIDTIVDLSTTATETSNVGEYAITGTTTNTNYNVTFVDGKYEITSREITVTIDDKTSVYGKDLVELTGSVTAGSLVTGDTIDTIVNLSTTATSTSNVGEYTITGIATNANYDITIIDGTYEITKATLTSEDFEKTIPTNKEYDGNAVTASANLKAEIVGAGTVTVKYYKDGVSSTEAPSDYGTYIVKVNVSEGTNYFATDEIEIGSFSITKKQLKAEDIEVTAPKPNTYDGTAKTPAVTPKVVGAGTIEAKYYDEEGNEVTNPTDAGTYTVKITTSGATNYEDVTTEIEVGTFEIVARPVEVTIDNKTSIYGNTIDTLTSNITDGTVITGDDLEITLTKANGTDVGVYAITGTATNTNYNVTFVDGKYTITARPITILTDNKESAIKDELVELTYQVTAGTIIGTDKVVILETNANKDTVGTYDITVKSKNTNYNVTIANTKGTYTVKDKVKEIKLSEETIEANCGTSLEDLINGITYTVVYVGDGEQTPQALTTGMITTTYNPNTTEIQPLTVTYIDNDTNSATNGDTFEVTLNVTLEDTLTSIRVENATIEYYEGQTFNADNKMEVTAEYNVASDKKVTNYVIKDKNGNILNRPLTQADSGIVTIEYEENGVKVSKDITITVKPDVIADITFNFNGTTEYDFGDNIDLGTSTVTKVWASGKIENVSMTEDMLSITEKPSFNFADMNEIGTYDVKVTIDGKTSDNTFQIKVKDAIENIEIVDKTILEKDYNYNQPIDVTDGQINIIYKSGNTDTEDITTTMLSGYSMTTLGEQTVTVTYTDNKGKKYTDTFKINVKDVIIGIDITKEPAKKLYKLNEAQSFVDLEVANVMASGKPGTKLTAGEYTITGFDSVAIGEKTITVTKNGTTYADTFKIKVIDVTTDMFISDLPKQTYKFGERLTLVGGTITVKTEGNVTGTVIPMTDASVKVTGYDANKLGDQELTVTYTYTEETETGIETKKLTDTYTVKVEDYETGYKVTPPTKTTYDYGDNLDLTGATVSIVWASGKTTDTTEISGGMISEYSATTLGTQTIKVNAFGKENVGSFEVSVVDKTLGISMNELPNKQTYTQGESLDITGAVLNVTKSSGINEVPVTLDMISEYNPNKVGTQVITVTYDGFTTEFVINVKEAPKKPTTPTKPERPVTPSKPTIPEIVKYTVTFINYDGTILKIEEVESGKSATAPEIEERTGYKFLGWNRDFDIVEKNITVMAKYEEIIRAEVNAPDNMQVEQGEDIDLSEVTLIIKDDEGNELDEIPVTLDMISGFNSDKVGRQVITVTYVNEDGFEYTATFEVKVIRPVETLGVKEEIAEKDNNLNGIIIPTAIGIGAIGILLLLIAIATRKNVEIYAITEEERKLVGKEKITKHDRRIVLDEYEKKLEKSNIEIVLNKKITKKLDKEMIDILFKGKKSTYKVKDEGNKEFSIKMKNA